MKMRAVGAGFLVLGLAAGACGGGTEEPSATVTCGAGTVLRGNECVAAGSPNAGGEAPCTGNGCDSGGVGGAKPMGGETNLGGTKPDAGSTSVGGMLGPSAGAGDGGMRNGGTPNGGVPSDAGMPSTSGAPSGGASDAGAGGVDNASGAAGIGGASPGKISDVVKSAGCGKAFSGTSGAKVTIQTSGVKDANCADRLSNGTPVCGPWSTPRDYYVYLPQNYDKNQAYNLIFQFPGCGGTGAGVYPLENNVNDTSIRVGVTPGPNSLGHGTNPEQGCFDTAEGDDSIDFVLYENLIDKLSGELCFDTNRVFASGDSLGGSLANELGCKYAGDPLRPIRGVLVNDGGLPTDPKYRPTCTNNPMAGIWVHQIGDPETPFAGNKVAINRAMSVNGCVGATSYDDAVNKNLLASYPIGGGNPDDTCKQIKGCPALYPLVVCALPGFQHSPNSSVANPAFATFVTGLAP